MNKSSRKGNLASLELRKAPTGVKGLDDITYGGLPQGRPTIVCGGPGCGKTMLAIEFLVHGALEYNEPGVFMAFEETPQDLAKNVASLSFDLKELVAKKKLFLDHVHVERSEIQEAGEYEYCLDPEAKGRARRRPHSKTAGRQPGLGCAGFKRSP